MHFEMQLKRYYRYTSGTLGKGIAVFARKSICYDTRIFWDVMPEKETLSKSDRVGTSGNTFRSRRIETRFGTFSNWESALRTLLRTWIYISMDCWGLFNGLRPNSSFTLLRSDMSGHPYSQPKHRSPRSKHSTSGSTTWTWSRTKPRPRIRHDKFCWKW